MWNPNSFIVVVVMEYSIFYVADTDIALKGWISNFTKYMKQAVACALHAKQLL